MSTVLHPSRETAPIAQQELSPTQPQTSRRLGQHLLRIVPTAATIGALVGLAAWGHHSEWTLPDVPWMHSEATVSSVAWCTDHNVPEDACIECRPDLLPKKQFYGWCKEHGVMQCPLEHPEVAELKNTPQVSSEMIARADRALSVRPRSENNSRCQLHERHVQFASTESVEKLGIDIAVAQERPMTEAISSNAELGYDETRMVHLTSRVPGNAWRVYKQVGDRVAAGDVLALIESPEVGKAKSSLLQAVSQLRLQSINLERLRPLGVDGVVPGRQIRETEAAYETARISLRESLQTLVNLGLSIRYEDIEKSNSDELSDMLHFLGVPLELAASLDAASTTSNLLPIRAPFDGVVTTRKLVEGEVVNLNEPLFAIADMSRLWLTLNIKLEDAAFTELGQQVLFRANNSYGETEVAGTVDWISTEADDTTRTIAVRAQVPNEEGRLRANTFGVGRIVLRQEAAAVVVPTESIHRDGPCQIVFVRDRNYFAPNAAKFFHVRAVRVGVQDGDATEIIAGLLPGEVVASTNSTILEAQLLKGNLGAGCCEVHAAKK